MSHKTDDFFFKNLSFIKEKLHIVGIRKLIGVFVSSKVDRTQKVELLCEKIHVDRKMLLRYLQAV